MRLTTDQQIAITKDVADSLRTKNMFNPTGITLLNELRRSSHKLLGVAIPNLKSVESWFPDLLSRELESAKEDAFLSLLSELSSRVSAVECQQDAIIQQNAETLKYLKAIHRQIKRLNYVQPSVSEVTRKRNLNVVVVGVEGGNREHLRNKLKGFPVQLTFKHFSDRPGTFGNPDYVVFFSKSGHYLGQTLDMWPGRVYYGQGAGGLSQVTQIIMDIVAKEGG